MVCKRERRGPNAQCVLSQEENNQATVDVGEKSIHFSLPDSRRDNITIQVIFPSRVTPEQVAGFPNFCYPLSEKTMLYCMGWTYDLRVTYAYVATSEPIDRVAHPIVCVIFSLM